MMRAIFFVGGLTLLLVGSHVTITRTVGYNDPGALLILALAGGVALGSLGIGYARSHGHPVIAAFLCISLVSGEAFGLLTTAERYVSSREAQQAPIHEQEAKRKAAQEWLARLEHDDRVERAEGSLREARADANAKSTARDCNKGCIATLAKTVDGATAAVEEARQSLQLERRQARATLDNAPLPPSANALADRLGLAGWELDLLIAALASLTCNGMAMGLIALGGHGRQRPELSPSSSPARAQPLELKSNVVTIARGRPSRLPVKIGDVDAFLLERVTHEQGARVSWADAFISYRGWCEASGCTPVDAGAFGARLDALRAELGLRTRTKGKDVFFVDLRLAS